MSADSIPRPGSILALMVLAVLPFCHGLFYPFVFDDSGVIIENTFLEDRARIRETLLMRTIGSPEVIDGQRPSVILSYFGDLWAWGHWPAGFRITNYLIHAANAALLFLLVMRLCGSRTLIAATATLVFAWHPLGIEVVHSPAFREDSLCLAGGLIFLLAGTRSQPSWYVIAAGIAGFMLSLLAKESGVIWPFLIGVIWWLSPLARPPSNKAAILLFLACALLLAYGYLLAGRGAAQAIGERWNGISLQGCEVWLSPPWLLMRSLAKIVAPWPLSVDYRIMPVVACSDVRFWIGSAGVIAILLVSWHLRRIRPAASIGMLWMMIAFIPVSNLWPLFNPVADRYAYLMIPGLVMAMTGMMPAARRTIVAGVFAAALGFALFTAVRIPDWKSERALWTAALAVEPESARAHAWLGIIENAEGRPDVAFNYFDTARTLNPQDPGPLVNMGVAKMGQGDAVAAEFYFREALRLNPAQKQARDNLALMGLAP